MGKNYSFAAPVKQHFNATKSRKYPRKYMVFKVVNQKNRIDAMKNCKT